MFQNIPFHVIFFLSVFFFRGFQADEIVKFDCTQNGTSTSPGVAKFPIGDVCDNRFVYCVTGKPFLGKCPPETAYNRDTNECDVQAQVAGCDGVDLGYQQHTAGAKFEGKDVNDCSLRESGLYPMVFGDCQDYLLCEHNRAYPKECPLNLVFDTESSECKMPSQSKCWKPNGPHGPSKYFPSQTVEYIPNFDFSESLTAVLANPEGPLTPQKDCPYAQRTPSEEFEKISNGIVLQNPVLKNDGSWLEWQMCPDGNFINGISSYRRSKTQKGKTDNAGMISIAFQCQTPEKMGKLDEVNATISAVAPGAPPTDGQFSKYWTCEDGGVAVGFQVNSETDHESKDDIATGNVRVICSCGPPAVKPYWLKGVYTAEANRAGDWTKEQLCQPKQAICGFQAQMMNYVDKVDLVVHDNTALNNLKMKCCDIPNPIATCTPVEREILVATCNNSASDTARICEFDGILGVGYDYSSQDQERAIYFHESSGFTLGDQMPILQQKMAGRELQCGSGTCLFPWQNATSPIWRVQEHGQLKTIVVGGWTAEIFQIMGQCEMYNIYTNRYMRMDTDGNQARMTRDFWDFENFEKSLLS